MAWNTHWSLIAAGLFVIVMLRANGTYWLARWLVSRAEHGEASKLVSSPRFRRAQRLVSRWGAPVVSLSFLTIGLQTMVNLAAGASRMSMRSYLPSVTVGCVMWALIYATVGFVGWRLVTTVWEQSPALAIGGLLGLVAAVLGMETLQRRHLVRLDTPTP